MPPTYAELRNGFQLGSWTVVPERGLLQKGDTSTHLEPMVIDVLLILASEHGNVVSKDALVERVWHGRSTADEAITTKIAALRHALGDDHKHPTYVETLPKRGYRLKASVDLHVLTDAKPTVAPSRRAAPKLILSGLLLAAIAAYLFWPTSAAIETIAVIPFRNLSDDQQSYQYVVDGFSEELVVSLNQIPDLRFTRGPELSGGQTPQRVANELGVDAIISGSLRTDGDHLRITVEMISASGFRIWADRIDGAARDIFRIQERVANEVRNKILGEREPAFRAATRPSNATAFDYYMRGLFFLAKRDPASLDQARTLFEKTIEIDPAFGPTYLRLAVTLLLQADFRPYQKQEIYDATLVIAGRGQSSTPIFVVLCNWFTGSSIISVVSGRKRQRRTKSRFMVSRLIQPFTTGTHASSVILASPISP